MDKIFLRGMKAETLIGVYEWERKQRQTLVLDLEIGVPEKSAVSDDIGDTVHYGEVCEAVRGSLSGQDFMLLEVLAEHVAKLILQDFGALWVRVRVVKPGILPNVQEVGVEIERSRG
ncbi:dihydroneopterin aldolase [Neisseria animalis]|uniref:7,8-dihydroneopterin aldolase n=1 Tax=Neisseria animalis TaxID=492 RepID=A0A5P3MTH0_NEIAN|nr:dihydroneopterin aldolase [Neisseria animalis]QEY24828.1 dihydroneopterin aldolase [Neisseria animalis]ROW31573.1 dihydroneopterin aldolase [Neisseria animalis]VEE07946.1 dihydroneopterin aldolase [Neisseria animalis]